ncbi:RNA polymerase II complex component [Cavenderia fasciculata]|uniref:RNA polymerase II complex component n=1 Tax=Cavenderia fasciculata TaxID=261658 RepID=F4PNT1_CACFS|nr:RNA polymerase II complex component [Cavenderia fasciculata]EGG23134.1 RNA polymerase II complex component [Cavenderia fasciculata]|eukprot:XP_004360985.1 RNA polymerase II complex component [Cavenderia fasciculata]
MAIAFDKIEQVNLKLSQLERVILQTKRHHDHIRDVQARIWSPTTVGFMLLFVSVAISMALIQNKVEENERLIQELKEQSVLNLREQITFYAFSTQLEDYINSAKGTIITRESILELEKIAKSLDTLKQQGVIKDPRPMKRNAQRPDVEYGYPWDDDTIFCGSDHIIDSDEDDIVSSINKKRSSSINNTSNATDDDDDDNIFGDEDEADNNEKKKRKKSSSSNDNNNKSSSSSKITRDDSEEEEEASGDDQNNEEEEQSGGSDREKKRKDKKKKDKKDKKKKKKEKKERREKKHKGSDSEQQQPSSSSDRHGGDEMVDDDTGYGGEYQEVEELKEVIRPPVHLTHIDSTPLPKAKIMKLKVLNILGIQPIPFHPKSYEKDEEIAERGRPSNVESVIRWRWALDQHGRPTKESNTRLIQWSDGSTHLFIGNEALEVKEHELAGDQFYVYNKQDNFIECEGKVDSKIAIRPTKVRSKAHMRLRESIASRTQKSAKIKSIVTTVDPEKEKVQRERAEAEKIRIARGQRDTKVNKLAQKLNLDTKYLEGEDGDEEEENSGFGYNGDGFIDDREYDDDEGDSYSGDDDDDDDDDGSGSEQEDEYDERRNENKLNNIKESTKTINNNKNRNNQSKSSTTTLEEILSESESEEERVNHKRR